MTRRDYLTYRRLVLWTVAWVVMTVAAGLALGLPL